MIEEELRKEIERLKAENARLAAEVQRCHKAMKRPANDWCRGIPLPDGNYTGCACDCPACEEAVKRSGLSDLLAPTIELLSICEDKCSSFTGTVELVPTIRKELSRLRALIKT